MEIKQINGVSYKRISIPCPDEKPGCCVAHYKWIPVDETQEKFVKLKHVQKLVELIKARDSFNDWSDSYRQYDVKVKNTIAWLERNAKIKEEI